MKKLTTKERQELKEIVKKTNPKVNEYITERLTAFINDVEEDDGFKLTNRDLADRAGVDDKLIGNILSGNHNVTVFNLFRICQVFNVPILEFLEGLDDYVEKKQ